MKITVIRYWYTLKSTCGILLLTDTTALFECYTLEPPVKTNDKQPKPYCIPAATYKATKYKSPHFGIDVISILDVPDFTDVEIHPGNDPSDTTACMVVGNTHAPDFVGNSKSTFSILMSLLPDSFDIEIQDGPKAEEPAKLSIDNIKTIFDKPKGSPVSMKS